MDEKKKPLDRMIEVVSKGSPLRPLELGKIKCGGLGETRQSQKGTPWRAPRKDDHFTIVTMNRNKAGDLEVDADLMAELLETYSDADGKLREIPIRLLSDEIDDVLQAQFAWYGRRACGARSDGQKVTWFYDAATFEPCVPPRVEDWTDEHQDMRDKQGNLMFKLHAVFSCVIASKQSRFGGVYKFRTTSVISFRQLYVSLVHISQLTEGTLMGMPLVLVLRPMHVTPEIGGQRKGMTVYVVHVELRGADLEQLEALALKRAEYRLQFSEKIRMMQSRYRSLLMVDETPEEQAAIAMEYAPEFQDDQTPQPSPSEAPDLGSLLEGDVGERSVNNRSTKKLVEPSPAELRDDEPTIAVEE